jgi:hypothetical protein
VFFQPSQKTRPCSKTFFHHCSYDDYPDDDDAQPKIDVLCQWLYQPLVREGIPRERLLFIDKYHDERSQIALFIDRIKQVCVKIAFELCPK